jgi:hypothetical protein
VSKIIKNFNHYIKLIKDKSIKFGVDSKNHTIYKHNNMYLYFWIDENNNYMDGMQYRVDKDILWTWSTPQEFYEQYINKDKQLKFIEYSFRKYGEPKLSKPKELKGIKQTFSIDYIPKKCKCPIFILGNDVWVQHNDYFSPSMDLPSEDIGMPLGVLCKKYLDKDKKNKFVYPDAWGDIVLRQQAWIKIENLMHRLRLGDFELDLLKDILRQQEMICGFKENELICTDMERFWERVIIECKKYS